MSTQKKDKKERSQEEMNIVDRAIEKVSGFESLNYRFCRSMSIDGKSEGTVTNYSRHVASMALHFGRIPTDLSAEEVHEYLYSLQNRSKTVSQSYFKHTVFSLRYLLKSENLPVSHLLLPSIKGDKSLPVVLSKEEVWRLLSSFKLMKQRLLIGTIYGCGLRCSEARNVRLRDLDFDRKRLHVVQGKGKKDRYVPLSDHLIRGLKTYIEKEKPKEWLFNGMSKRRADGASDLRYSKRSIQIAVKEAVKLAGILKDAHVHTLRHSYATHLLEDGLDIMTLKDLLGHSRIQTKMVMVIELVEI